MMRDILRRPTVRIAFVLTILVHAALAAWVARDARRSGRDAGLWPIATLVGGVVAVIAYTRRPG